MNGMNRGAEVSARALTVCGPGNVLNPLGQLVAALAALRNVGELGGQESVEFVLGQRPSHGLRRVHPLQLL